MRSLGTHGHARVSISTGAARRLPADTAATLIRRADTAMFRNKVHHPPERRDTAHTMF